MNEQFKIELQQLLKRYPDVQGVTVKMVTSFEISAQDNQALESTKQEQLLPKQFIPEPEIKSIKNPNYVMPKEADLVMAEAMSLPPIFK